MKVKKTLENKVNGSKKEIEIVEFDSLNEFYKYITETEVNNAFKNLPLHSNTGSKKFTGTDTFSEAVNLFKYGWKEEAENLTQKLKAIEKETMVKTKQKPCLSVAGYQVVVPLYLQGVPNNMVNKKMVPVKQKVVTINKPISYAAKITKEQILEESIKALQMIKKIESQGVRCNLNIAWAVNADDKTIIVKIKVKSANEKMNISKLAFPLVHPSMLRRLAFRFLEVYPGVTQKFTWGYGYPLSSYEMKKYFDEKEYILPRFMKQEVNSVDDLDNLILD